MAANRTFDQLDLKEKIGQLFMCGFDGLEPTDDILSLIAEYGLGGVIYFRRNVRDAAQVAELSSKLQAAAADPLFIAIDQEGGMVVRLEEGVTVMPGAMAQGAADRAELTGEAAKLSGAELRAIGINMNFAPCLDVNNNPLNPVIGVRSYGEDPNHVAALGTAAINGYRDGGIVAVAKHFPGHGDTAADSHHELPSVPHGVERLNEVELLPFRQAIEQKVDAIMTAHVVFPAFEPGGIPATLSRRILSGLLRDQLGFDGVIVTDCLEMNAIAETIGVARGAVEAIKAGADLILVSHRIVRQTAALEAVMEAVMTGEIAEARIDEAARRIWELKHNRGLFADAAPATDAARAEEVQRLLCEASVTVVKGGDRLPLSKDGNTVVVWVEARVGTEVIEVIKQEWTLGAALTQAGYDIAEVRIGLDPTAEEAADVRNAIEGSRTVIFASYDAGFSAGQTALIRELSANDNYAFVWVAMRTPYDLLVAPEAPVYLCVYENKPAMMTAVAGVLSGELPLSAKLPVTIGEYARVTAL
ncbi:beta-N-acetylhexosaminidase [Cohnella endophytica]|uniref:Beta-N-acetylhexosaminidase n=1 Tax=Cohnella endophytica TaxID=2419778 RepID=A0A494XWZ3_9BACL|nr:beta-N-acetylhexosaminidase [Cohnella endophytica]RKP55117.1 beta-N-acetylhexosaminidase [Cohnella endophytica]